MFRTRGGHDVFSPITYINYPFTKDAYGKPVILSLIEIKSLQENNPKAYVRVLYTDGVTARFVQVRNLNIDTERI